MDSAKASHPAGAAGLSLSCGALQVPRLQSRESRPDPLEGRMVDDLNKLNGLCRAEASYTVCAGFNLLTGTVLDISSQSIRPSPLKRASARETLTFPATTSTRWPARAGATSA